MGINPQTENIEEVTEYAKENVSYQEGGYIAKFSSKKKHPQLPSNLKMVHNITRAIFLSLAKDPTPLKFSASRFKNNWTINSLK
jgi:hypothetical protein